MATRKKAADDSDAKPAKSATPSKKGSKKVVSDIAASETENPKPSTKTQKAAASEPAAEVSAPADSAAHPDPEAPAAATPKGEGEVSNLDGVALPAASGKAGVLGGPKDRGIKSDDKLALPAGKFFTYERVLSLNPKSFYCAMRWDYHLPGKSPEEGKRWWANKKILVTNPANGRQVIVRAVDFGPHESTGLTISLSPGALDALGIEIGADVEIAFADQKAPLGEISQ